jgi:hypothetical protein
MAAQRHAPLQSLSLISECFQGKFSSYQPAKIGGARRDRTDDLKLAKLALSQLSYGPVLQDIWSSLKLVGLSGLEPLTSRLSGVCSNHLSYRPLTVRRPSGRRSGAYAPPRRSSRGLRPDDRLPIGIPIGLNLPNILGRKRNEAGARAIADLRLP